MQKEVMAFRVEKERAARLREIGGGSFTRAMNEAIEMLFKRYRRKGTK